MARDRSKFFAYRIPNAGQDKILLRGTTYVRILDSDNGVEGVPVQSLPGLYQRLPQLPDRGAFEQVLLPCFRYLVSDLATQDMNPLRDVPFCSQCLASPWRSNDN